jgi:ParB family chromosome partitioning protein
MELALIENIQRQDLNAIEEARAFKFLIDKFKLTQERLSAVLGKSRVTVTNILRLLELPQEIQEEIKRGRITFAHGRALLEVADPNYQRKLVQETISRGLSVKELEAIIKTHRPRPKQRMRQARPADPYLAVLEEEMQHVLATKVRIEKRKKQGHITIEFYSQQDLERIVALIRGGKNA